MPPAPLDRTQVFVGLLLKAEPQIAGFVRAQILDRNDADDVFQETAKVLWEKFGEFQEGTNFVAWAYQIARYKVQQYYQEQQRQARKFNSEVLELIAQTSESLGNEIPDMRQALVNCMEKLPGSDRDIVQRCYAIGASVRAVADELGRPFETIRSVLKRSRRTLFECIQRTLSREARE